ncbi:hypothetical protein [Microscilla marina]|uniref:Uncharacterized protein n=1 Tax=Microscilla marina ATCC 23134 TaxID=313606 RepID=A1ZSJ5_MICM2|nr:hypothetical protein [Microscilla marina]EAY26575.1 hypothetical protein M23134_06102 [Microscilla marina ATCC 23134]
MKKLAILCLITLFFASSNAMAQRKKRSTKEYKAMMSFDFKGKTWIYSHQEDKDGNILENEAFFKRQRIVLDIKKKEAYKVVTTAEVNKSRFRMTPSSNDTNFHLRYYMLSCGFMDLYAPLNKEKKNTLHFKQGASTLVFIAKQ